MGQVAEVVGGGTPSTSEPVNWNGDVPWITPADLSGYSHKTISGGARTISERGIVGSGARMLPVGTVLMSSRAPVGYVAIAARPLSTNQGFKSFVLRGDLLPDYVYWYFKGGRDLLNEFASGTTFPEVSGRRAAEIPIPIAPLAEQRRIVAAVEEHLSDLDAAVAGLERTRLNHRRYRNAVLRAVADGSLLGDADQRQQGPEPWSPSVPSHWTFATVEELAEFVEYGTSAKTQEGDDGVPVLRMGNIVDGEVSWANLKYLPASHVEFPRLLLSPGDVLFNRTNSPELVGKTAMYEGGHHQASFASYLLRIRLKPGLDPRFFSAFVNSSYGRAWVAGVVSQQVGQANVNGAKLRALRIPVPPEYEQESLVTEMRTRLDSAHRVMKDVDVQLARAARLRQSILRRAFEGRLIPQDPSDEPANALLERILTAAHATGVRGTVTRGTTSRSFARRGRT